MSIQLPPVFSLFSGLDIPPDDKDFAIRDSYTLPVAVDAVSIGAHAHYIGKSMKMTATLPDGEVKTLLWIKDWDFAWQDRYYFQQLVPLPAGTRIEAEIHWDNTAENPRNPADPAVRVTGEEHSEDEMGSVTVAAVPHQESDLTVLRADILKNWHQTARKRLLTDPQLSIKLWELTRQ